MLNDILPVHLVTDGRCMRETASGEGLIEEQRKASAEGRIMYHTTVCTRLLLCNAGKSGFAWQE